MAVIYPAKTQLKKAMRVKKDTTMLPQHQAKFLVNFFSKSLRSSLVAKLVIHTTLSKKNFKAAKPAPSVITSVINCCRQSSALSWYTTESNFVTKKSSKDSILALTRFSEDLISLCRNSISALVAKLSVTLIRTSRCALACLSGIPESVRVVKALLVSKAAVFIRNPFPKSVHCTKYRVPGRLYQW